MEIRAQVGENSQHGARQKEKHLVDQGQNKADGHGHDKGDDLVAGQGRGKQSNRAKGRSQKDSAKVAAYHRTPVKLSEGRYGDRVHKCRYQHGNDKSDRR